LKDAARLLAYLGATVLFGAVAAPILFWAAQWLAVHGIFPKLATFDFEAYFHRALLLGALLFLWPFLRSLQIRSPRDLGLVPNRAWIRDVAIGFLISALPTLCCGILLVAFGNYTMRSEVAWGAVGSVVLTAAVVPFIEEGFFRGLIQGIILRDNRPLTATLLSAGVFAIIHFLKAPEETTTSVTWASGFLSLAHSFDQFAEPMLVLAGCTTLFLIGVILAHARLRTRSLWLPIGLHVGWIFASSEFNKVAHRELVVLPWLGKNLLVGIVPLFVCFVSWILLGVFLKYGVARKS
jgi:membrane protease YdiL (CAAX protease family)